MKSIFFVVVALILSFLTIAALASECQAAPLRAEIVVRSSKVKSAVALDELATMLARSEEIRIATRK